ncbi:hypothetical protein BDZ45DRAFT_749270 [Acephala macrosclerotiorum]|nr:hypothetical protein BDZ45DRAFT_749270 [Acephala macrosclerotiorum]
MIALSDSPKLQKAHTFGLSLSPKHGYQYGGSENEPACYPEVGVLMLTAAVITINTTTPTSEGCARERPTTIGLLKKKVGSLKGDVKRKDKIIEQKDKSRAELIKDHNGKTFEMNKKIGSRDATIRDLNGQISEMEAGIYSYDNVPGSPGDPQAPGRSPFYPGSPCGNCQVIDYWSPDCTKPCIHCGSSSHLESATCDAYYHDLKLKREAEADDSETGFSHPKRIKTRHKGG